MIRQRNVKEITTGATLTVSQMGDMFCSSTSAQTYKMPAVSDGLWYRLTNINAGIVTATNPSDVALKVLYQDESCLFLNNGTNWYIAGGLKTPSWNDIYIPLAAAKVPASNAPTWSTYSSNLKSYTFGLNDYADLSTVEILHNWKEGTDIDVHVHIITDGDNNATARKVKYQIFYDIGDMGEQMAGEANFSGEEDIPANEPDITHHYIDIGEITGTNYKVGSLLKLRVKRIAGTGVEPISDPFVEMIGVHYQIDTLGSRTEFVK